jgi:hypothetical protein
LWAATWRGAGVPLPLVLAGRLQSGLFRAVGMIEITCNNRFEKMVWIKGNEDDTIGDLKNLMATQTGMPRH